MNFNREDVDVSALWNNNGFGSPFCTIKVTHVPTGISVESDKDRSRYKMREQAIDALKELVEARLI